MLLRPLFVDDDDFAGPPRRGQTWRGSNRAQFFRWPVPRRHDFPDAERTKSVGITDPDQLLLGHDHEGVSPFDPMPPSGSGCSWRPRRLSHQVQNDFAIDRSFKIERAIPSSSRN